MLLSAFCQGRCIWMLSVGIDMVEIARIKKSIQNERFIDRVYGENEREEFKLRNAHARSFAAAFAAKEAFSKALGTGIRGFSLYEVQLVHDSLGAPRLHLSGSALEIANSRGLDFAVSVTHTDEYATAVVIADKKG